MPMTPWGPSETLRERRVAVGGGTSQGEARRNQRERLFGAMIACCEERGYEGTSVADLLEVSGVSRGTFYAHFEDKLDCFEATLEAVVADVVTAVTHRLGGEREVDPEARINTALERFVSLIVAQPAAARMAFVHSYAAGGRGVAPVRRAVEAIIALGQTVLEQLPGRGRMPDDLARPLVGGFYQVVYARLQERREAELPGMVPRLWEWGVSYPAPPQDLTGAGRRGPTPPESPAPPPFAALDPEQRIIRAFAAAVARKGYIETTIADVAAAGSFSQSTFYEHFADKADVMAAALDSSGAQLLAAVLPPAARAADWPAATRSMLSGTCNFFACEPDFAVLRNVAVYAAGPEAIARRNESGGGTRGLLFGGGREDAPPVDPLVAEAISGAVYGTLYERIRTQGAASLPALVPLLTYVALAPVIGAEEACAVANGKSAGRLSL